KGNHAVSSAAVVGKRLPEAKCARGVRASVRTKPEHETPSPHPQPLSQINVVGRSADRRSVRVAYEPQAVMDERNRERVRISQDAVCRAESEVLGPIASKVAAALGRSVFL